jgi:drug/metabolite transporter (DMT)-like permease
MDGLSEQRPPVRLSALVIGFAAIYLIWGSTYLGIKIAVETWPPFLMAGLRFTVAGMPLLVWSWLRGARPTWRQWLLAGLTGALLLPCSNGLVTWGQRLVPTGRAALLVATTPVWMAVVGWLFYGLARPGFRVIVGMIAGFIGAALLIQAPAAEAGEGALVGYLAMGAAPLLWAIGTLQMRRSHIADDALLVSAMQMVVGGLLMVLLGSLMGEWPVLLTRGVSLRSGAAFCYLTVVGSLIGFSTFAWLCRVASPTAVVTYAYVNPLVAVVLGWMLNGEKLDAIVFVAAGLILGAVVVITLPKRRSPTVAVAVAEEKTPPVSPREKLAGVAND